MKITIFFLLCFMTKVYSQQFLQIETTNDPIAIKYNIGEELVIKTTLNNDWRKRKIKNFLYKENAILFEDGFELLKDITAVQTTRPWAKVIGKGMMSFGAGWFLFGGISSLTNQKEEDKFGWDYFSIGAAAIGTGFLIDKAFYRRKINIGSRYRLRLLDLRMSTEN